MKNPKLTVSMIITILTTLYTLLVDNAAILNIDAGTLAIISFIISAISVVWKAIKPEESAFTMIAKSIPGGGVKPPKK